MKYHGQKAIWKGLTAESGKQCGEEISVREFAAVAQERCKEHLRQNRRERAKGATGTSSGDH